MKHTLPACVSESGDDAKHLKPCSTTLDCRIGIGIYGSNAVAGRFMEANQSTLTVGSTRRQCWSIFTFRTVSTCPFGLRAFAARMISQ